MQIIVIGSSPVATAIFETLIMLAAEFHHANVGLPLGFERRLNALVVTPRMHGIHHSIIEQESDSNFGTALTLWDVLLKSGEAYLADYSDKDIARLYSKARRYDEAAEVYRQILRARPSDVTAHVELSLAQGNREMAMKEYEAVRGVNSSVAEGLLKLINK